MSNHHQGTTSKSGGRTTTSTRQRKSKANHLTTTYAPTNKLEAFRRWVREIGLCAEESHHTLLKIGALIGVLVFVLFLAAKAIAEALR